MITIKSRLACVPNGSNGFEKTWVNLWTSLFWYFCSWCWYTVYYSFQVIGRNVTKKHQKDNNSYINEPFILIKFCLYLYLIYYVSKLRFCTISSFWYRKIIGHNGVLWKKNKKSTEPPFSNFFGKNGFCSLSKTQLKIYTGCFRWWRVLI